MKPMPSEEEIHRRCYREISEKLKQDAFARHLGIELVELGEGRAVTEMVIGNHMLNAHGTAHGGAIFALADAAFAAACNSYGKTSVALSMNIGYLAPGVTGERLRAIAEEEKRTHRTSWYRIRVESERETVAILDALAYRKNDYFVPVERE